MTPDQLSAIRERLDAAGHRVEEAELGHDAGNLHGSRAGGYAPCLGEDGQPRRHGGGRGHAHPDGHSRRTAQSGPCYRSGGVVAPTRFPGKRHLAADVIRGRFNQSWPNARGVT